MGLVHSVALDSSIYRPLSVILNNSRTSPSIPHTAAQCNRKQWRHSDIAYNNSHNSPSIPHTAAQCTSQWHRVKLQSHQHCDATAFPRRLTKIQRWAASRAIASNSAATQCHRSGNAVSSHRKPIAARTLSMHKTSAETSTSS